MIDVDYIRKTASLQMGKKVFEDQEVDVVSEVFLHKLGSATDKGLLAVAQSLDGDTLQNYEVLGGQFKKEAIGAPMFSGGAAPPPGVGAPSAGAQPAGAGVGGAPKMPKPGQQQGQGSQGPQMPSMNIQTPSEPKIPGQSGVGGSKTAGKLVRPPFGGSGFEKTVWKLKQRVARVGRAAKKRVTTPTKEKLRSAVEPKGSALEYIGVLPAAALGAGAMGTSAGVRTALTPKSERKKAEEKMGPIGRFSLKHPVTTGAGLGALALPLALRAKTLPGALAGSVAPGVAAAVVDRILKLREDKEK